MYLFTYIKLVHLRTCTSPFRVRSCCRQPRTDPQHEVLRGQGRCRVSPMFSPLDGWMLLLAFLGLLGSYSPPWGWLPIIHSRSPAHPLALAGSSVATMAADTATAAIGWNATRGPSALDARPAARRAGRSSPPVTLSCTRRGSARSAATPAPTPSWGATTSCRATRSRHMWRTCKEEGGVR